MKRIIPFLAVLIFSFMVVFILQYCKKSDSDSSNNNNNNNNNNKPCTPKPSTPLATSNGPVKIGDTIHLRASNVDVGDTIHWTGPHGYSAVGQVVSLINAQPINAGNYYVTKTRNRCKSDSTFTFVDVRTLKSYTFQGHTFVILPNDYKDHMPWNNGTNHLTNASSDVDGLTNQAVIISVQGWDYMYAALVCKNTKDFGYSDWYLPAKDELDRIYFNKDILGGFTNEQYWSSSESSVTEAMTEDFSDGTQAPTMKNTACLVRCIKRIN